MSKPDFIGVGTERAGTSWVFSMIAHHPQSWVPPLKELHFLDAIDPDVPCHNPRFKWHLTARLKQKLAPFLKINERPEFYKNNFFEYLLWDFYFFMGKINFKWYQKLFSDVFVKGRVAGEYTPAYCNISQNYIKKLLQINPKMKFIMMVRNPCQQLRSSLIQNFVMIEKRNFETVSEEEMMAWLNSEFADHKANLKVILQKWQSHIPQDQLFVEAYEEIKNNPVKLIKNIYSFLGLGSDFLPDKKFYNRKINNLTKPTYQLPINVQNHIDSKFNEEIEFVQTNYPNLIKYWSKK